MRFDVFGGNSGLFHRDFQEIQRLESSKNFSVKQKKARLHDFEWDLNPLVSNMNLVEPFRLQKLLRKFFS